MPSRSCWCSCQPVAFIMAAIVTPLGCPRRARTASCLVLLRLEGVLPPFAGFFTRPLVRANLILVRVLLCNISDPFGCDGMQRRHHRSPTVAASPAGRDPARAKRPVNGSDTDTPFATEVQSFLPFDMWRRVEAGSQFESSRAHHQLSNPLIVLLKILGSAATAAAASGNRAVKTGTA